MTPFDAAASPVLLLRSSGTPPFLPRPLSRAAARPEPLVPPSPAPPLARSPSSRSLPVAKMTAGYIVGSLVGSFAIAYLCDTFVSDKKAFGGSIPKTVSEKEWWQATDTKFQAWPRTAGPPVVMNPISRQNFIVKSTE